MTNNYEVAEIIELGRAQDIVLGDKIVDDYMDSVTFELGQRVINAANE